MALIATIDVSVATIQPKRHRIVVNEPPWQCVMAGIERAEITIVNRSNTKAWCSRVFKRGSEYGYDCDSRTISEWTSDAGDIP
jgi:hypothetical protein